MAVQTRPTLKSWFESLDKPTQQQFWDWLDSYWHKSDSIPVESITGLPEIPSQAEIDAIAALVLDVEIEITGSGTYVLPMKRLLTAITFFGTGSFKVGTSAGGEQIVPDISVTDQEIFDIFFIRPSNVTLYFTGIGTVILHF